MTIDWRKGMRPRWLLVLALGALVAGGCEKQIDDADWPDYQERLVVVAEAATDGDSLTVICAVTKTLPLTTQYARSAALVRDADVRVVVDGATYAVPGADMVPVTMRNSRFSRVQVNSEPVYAARIPWHGGSVVRLDVRRGALTAISSIALPDAPVADTVVYEPMAQSLTAYGRFMADGSHYALHLSVVKLDGNIIEDDFEFERSASPSNDAVWTAVVGYIPDPRVIRYRVLRVGAAYSRWEQAAGWDFSSDDIFENSNGKNPPFNVHGDGIGFFWDAAQGPWREYRP